MSVLRFKARRVAWLVTTPGWAEALAVGLAVACVAVLLSALWVRGPRVLRPVFATQGSASAATVRVLRFVYRAADGAARRAYVVLPAWYGPRRDPLLPLVIVPHGRGLLGTSVVRLWGRLPALGSFALVAPDGEGRYSWGAPGQIKDLARMPRLVARALPWVRIARGRVYAFGGSMGGQEALLLVARYPRLLAGAAAFDSVADFAYQYGEFKFLRCNEHCERSWDGPIGPALQQIAREELGGTPRRDPYAYARRSPLTYASQIARSGVPIELWWSKADLIVRNQAEQSGELYARIKQLNPSAPIEAFIGSWIHTAEMRPNRLLPFALAQYGLLPTLYDHPPPHARFLRTPGSWINTTNTAVPTPLAHRS